MAVAAMVGMYFLPSFHLVIALQMSADPKTHKKPTTNPTNYLHQYLADEDILSTHPLPDSRIEALKKLLVNHSETSTHSDLDSIWLKLKLQ